MGKIRLALEIVVLPVIPADENHRQCTAHIGCIEVGRIDALDIDEAVASVAPRARPAEELSLCLLRQIDENRSDRD